MLFNYNEYDDLLKKVSGKCFADNYSLARSDEKDKE
ncbi:hypothetical protein QF004_000503 [Chryseobacterium sp. MDT2-18]|nr:hypothetical protein [Chryseobacterium sp. MDT2-18]